MKELQIRYATEKECPNDMWGVSESLAYKHYLKKYKPDELPDKLHVPIYVSYVLRDGSVAIDETSLYLDSEDHRNTRISLAKLILTVPLPKLTKEACIENLVASLKREREKIVAESTMQINELDHKIQNLLAITYEGSGSYETLKEHYPDLAAQVDKAEEQCRTAMLSASVEGDIIP